MKMTLKIALATVAMVWITAQAAMAQSNQFVLRFVATSITTNSFGKMLVLPVDGRVMVANCALENGITNPTSLVLVYDADDNTVKVVQKTDGSVVCVPLTLQDSVGIANPTATVRERLAFVFRDSDTQASGTVEGTELRTRGLSGTLAKYVFSGKILIAYPATDTQKAVIYRGTFSTGLRFVPTNPPNN